MAHSPVLVVITDDNRVARARIMLAQQRTALQAAIPALAAHRFETANLRLARRLLAEVRSFERDSDHFVTLSLGFLGENGKAPLIRSVCAAAARLTAGKAVAA